MKAWFDYKYIALVVNEARFIQHKFGEERIEKKSKLTWHALNYNIRTDVVKLITRSELQLGDSIYNVAGLMNERENVYMI